MYDDCIEIKYFQIKKSKNQDNHTQNSFSLSQIFSFSFLFLFLCSTGIYAQIKHPDLRFTATTFGRLNNNLPAYVAVSDTKSGNHLNLPRFRDSPPRQDVFLKVEVNIIENYAVLENNIFKIKYSNRIFSDNATNNIITELLIKSAPNENQAGDGQIDGVWMGYGIGRGALSNGSYIKYDGNDKKILHLEWGNGLVIQEFTIYPNCPVIKIDYIKYGINIVDIGSPGGASKGSYNFFGAMEWQQLRQMVKNPGHVNNPNEHHKLTYDLYPAYPNPIIDVPDWEGLEPIPMTYKGPLIMGLYNNSNGRGYGRVMPAASINYLKLLWNRGFEGFPYWMGEGKKGGSRHAFVGYLFVVSSGANEITQIGKSIVDDDFVKSD